MDLTMTNGVYGLLGVNGAGKDDAHEDALHAASAPPPEVSPATGKISSGWVRTYRRLLGYLPQDFGFYPEFTVRDYLLYIASLKGLRPAVAKKRGPRSDLSGGSFQSCG